MMDDHVYGIKRTFEPTKDNYDKAMEITTKEGEKLSKADFNKIKNLWYAPSRRYKKNWIYQGVRHGYFATGIRIENYICMTGALMLKFLGDGSSQNIKRILAELGYLPGFFYDAKEMVRKVSARLGFDIYVVFMLDDGIPTLHYFCIATNRSWVVIPHPSCHRIETGMFLFPRYTE